MDINLDYLISFRQSIHQNPELSGNEEYTAEALKRTILKYQPDELLDNLGGFGLAFVFEGKEKGPSVMFRSAMDALPILEVSDIDYASRVNGVGHQSGHDGHIAILLGLTEYVSNNRPEKGRVIMLFQPSEETGEGAEAVMKDARFNEILPDVVFSLHNIPGYPKGSLIVTDHIFSAASQGIVVKLIGKTSHAAEPEKGVSPAVAMARIIESILKLPEKRYLFKDFILTTIAYARLGDYSFGTSPGDAEILITLRSHNDADMNELIEHAQSVIYLISSESGLETEIKFTDIYPTLKNDPELINTFVSLAEDNKCSVVRQSKPFPWAEDFARFTHQYPSLMFGLGAGEDEMELHSDRYNFPDDIILHGIKAYAMLYDYYFKK